MAAPATRIAVEPGFTAMASGRARWCQGCDRVRYAHDMAWTPDGLRYRCRHCEPVTTT